MLNGVKLIIAFMENKNLIGEFMNKYFQRAKVELTSYAFIRELHQIQVGLDLPKTKAFIKS